MQLERDALRVIKYAHRCNLIHINEHIDTSLDVRIRRAISVHTNTCATPKKTFDVLENAFPCSNLTGRVS